MVRLSMRRLLKHLQPLAQLQLERSVEGVLDRTALHVRVTLKDEAMPPIVQRCVDDLVGGLLRDVKLECWRWTDERFTTTVDHRSLHTGFSPLTPRQRRARTRNAPSCSARAAAHCPGLLGLGPPGASPRRQPAPRTRG